MAQLDAHEAGDYEYGLPGSPGPGPGAGGPGGPGGSFWGDMHAPAHTAHTGSWPYEEDDAAYEYYDWSRIEVPPSRPLRRRRRWDEIKRPAYSSYSAYEYAAAPSSRQQQQQRPAVTRCASVLLSSPSGMRHHNSDTPLSGRHPAVPSSIARAETAPSGKLSFQQQQPQQQQHYEYYQRSPSGSHRTASQRDLSPLYRSTPVSRRSMRSSLGESGNDTDLTRPTREEDEDDDDDDDDEEDDNYDDDEEEEDDDDIGPARSIFAGRKSLRDRLGGASKRPSQQDFTSASSSRRQQRQTQSQTQTQTQSQTQTKSRKKSRHRHTRVDSDLADGVDAAVDPRREADQLSSILQQQQDYPSPPPPRDSLRHPSRASSIRGRPRAQHRANADAEMDNDGLDDDRRRPRPRRQQTPPRRARRSLSRTTTDRRNASRSKSRVRPRGDNDDFNPRASSRRPTNRYCETEIPDYAGSPATLRRAQTHGANTFAAGSPGMGSPKRPASLFESPLDNTSYAFPSEKTSKRAQCMLCHDEFSSRLAKLECGHRMCATCLKKKFKASLSDSRQMPPRCCSAEPINLRHVDKLLDTNFKRIWNDRHREVALDRQMYCPKCGLVVTPDNQFSENGRKAAQCGRCRTKICGQCNGKAHASRECPLDERTQLLLDNLRGEGRQHCHKCKAEVKYLEGRSHLTCGQCHAETCMICGRKWKHCGCPVFDCDPPEPARTEYGGQHHYASTTIHHDRFASAPPGPVPVQSPQRDLRTRNRSSERPFSSGRPMRSRAQSFDEKSRLRSRVDERRADDFGHRMNSYHSFHGGHANDDDDDDDDARTEAYARSVYRSRFDRDRSRQPSRVRAEDDFAIRPRRRGSFAVDDFEDRAATDIMPSVPPAMPTPPQQKAQAASVVVHRFQPQHHQQQQQQPQQHVPPPMPPQSEILYQQEYIPHARQPVPPSQHPGDMYNTTPTRPSWPAAHADSEVGRLADRFSKDSRSSPMHRSSQQQPPPPPPPPPAQGLSMAGMAGQMPAPMPMGMGMGMGLPPGPPMSRAPVGSMAPLMAPMGGMGPQSMAPPPTGMHPSSMHPGGMHPGSIHPMAMMPMSALAPVGHMADMRMMRHHMLEEDAYAQSELAAMYPGSQVPFPDTTGASSSRHYESAEADVFASSSGINRRLRRRGDDAALQSAQARSSEMAGLGGFGRGMDRVSEWRAYVGGEPPEEGSEIVSSAV